MTNIPPIETDEATKSLLTCWAPPKSTTDTSHMLKMAAGHAFDARSFQNEISDAIDNCLLPESKDRQDHPALIAIQKLVRAAANKVRLCERLHAAIMFGIEIEASSKEIETVFQKLLADVCDKSATQRR